MTLLEKTRKALFATYIKAGCKNPKLVEEKLRILALAMQLCNPKKYGRYADTQPPATEKN